MNIVVNGKNFNFDKSISVANLLEFLKIEDKVMAAAINMEIIKKSDWKSYKIADGDKVELLHFVGGG